MKKVKSVLSNDIGILLSILFYICFIAVARPLMPYLGGSNWYFFSSLQRIIFGLIELAIFVKIFHKGKWTNIINFTHFKDGLRAGSALILYTVLVVIVMTAGIGSLADTTFATLFSCLICQQAATGFWEELTFRLFLLEGYFNKEKKNRLCRLTYASISFIVFGLIHAVERNNLKDAIDIFIVTGIFGFVYASIYLYSHNILVPMLLHFIYDIFANLQHFVEVWNEDSQLFNVLNNYVLVAGFYSMFVVSLIFVLKEPVYEEVNNK